jgi:SAM-dependent methyltransferase
MSTETGSPPQFSLKDWWKTAFETDVYRILGPAERGPQILDTEMQLLPEWLQLQQGQTVLDLACGDGRLSVPLSSAGYKVIGLDQSQKLLGMARRRLAETQGRLELIQGDMRAFQLPKPVDAAICTFVSFGMFLDERDHLRTLQAVAAAVKPGGRLYLEVFNPQFYVWPTEEIANTNDLMLLYQTVLDHWKGRVNLTIHFAPKDKPAQIALLTYRAFALWEIVRLLEEVGFTVVRACGGMRTPDDFNPVLHSTLGLVAERRQPPAAEPGDPPAAKAERPQGSALPPRR